jgi:hypothetical protein
MVTPMSKGPSRQLFNFLCADFEKAWDAMAMSEIAPDVGGNLLFVRQAMLLVELASQVASEDPATFERFSSELQALEPVLFKRIPHKPKRTHRKVPRIASPGDPSGELIALLFDLVRNGQAHYGIQLHARLTDGHLFGVSVSGVRKGRTLDTLRPGGGRAIGHLAVNHQRDGDYVLWLCPGTLYLDVRDASERAGVWSLDADLSAWTRNWPLSTGDLEAALLDPTGPYVTIFRPDEPDDSGAIGRSDVAPEPRAHESAER